MDIRKRTQYTLDDDNGNDVTHHRRASHISPNILLFHFDKCCIYHIFQSNSFRCCCYSLILSRSLLNTLFFPTLNHMVLSGILYFCVFAAHLFACLFAPKLNRLVWRMVNEERTKTINIVQMKR